MRAYFFIGDVLTTGLTGAVAGLAAVALTGVGWNMALAMFLGMNLGMALAMPVCLVMGIWFGAFELMLPSMLGGMLSGMVVAMWEAHSGVGLAEAALVGTIWAWAALLATYLTNAALRGEVKQ
ncbi:MAG: hypothetical protein H6509_06425 [Bryobacterales bacterium]|nr:hypothetical protein [Bryobacterales bacterium]